MIEDSNKDSKSQNIKIDIPTSEIVISMTTVNNKILQPKLYHKAIEDLIYNSHSRKTIKNKLQNLENY